MDSMPTVFCENLVGVVAVLKRVFPDAAAIHRYHDVATEIFMDAKKCERELDASTPIFQPWVAAAALKPVETCFWQRLRPFTTLWKYMGPDPISVMREAGVVDEIGEYIARMAEACSIRSMLGVLPPEMRANIAALTDAMGAEGGAPDVGALMGRLLQGL